MGFALSGVTGVSARVEQIANLPTWEQEELEVEVLDVAVQEFATSSRTRAPVGSVPTVDSVTWEEEEEEDLRVAVEGELTL